MADRIVTIAASGGDYTSFVAAIAGEADFQAGEDNIVFNRIDNVRDSNAIELTSGFTTDTSHRLVFSCNADVMHNGTRGSGAGIVAAAHYIDAFHVGLNYIDVYRLEICNTDASPSSALRLTGGSSLVVDCLAYDSSIGIQTDKNESRVINCLSYNNSNFGFYNEGGWGTVHYYNCTALNCGYGWREPNAIEKHLVNCYAGGSATADYSMGGTHTLTTCASSDGTEGTTEIEVSACDFTNVTAGSENAHIASTSDLIGIGTDLRADATYNVTLDFEGNTRKATPDIGADEYETTTWDVTGSHTLGELLQSGTLDYTPPQFYVSGSHALSGLIQSGSLHNYAPHHTILLHRGLKATIPVAEAGEPLWTLDTHELYIGTSTGNAQIADMVYVDSHINNVSNPHEVTLQQVTSTGNTTSLQIVSILPSGTAPFQVASSTGVTNLNSDLWDGYQFSNYLNQAVRTSDSPSFNRITSTVSPGTAPFTVASNTVVTLLNSDFWDGYHYTDLFPVQESNMFLNAGSSLWNATSTRHGFLVPLSDNANQFLDGKGNWTTPTGGQPNSYSLTTFTSQTSVQIIHGWGTYPIVQVLLTSTSTGITIAPYSIVHNTLDDFTVTFIAVTSGSIIASVGSPQPMAYKQVTADYTVLVTDRILEVTVSGKNITLYTAIGNTGRTVIVDNSSSADITLLPFGAQTIEGETSQTIPSQSLINLYSNGANWRIG